MAIGREARRAERASLVESVLGQSQASAGLDLLELIEYAWHDCYQEITPPDDVILNILICSRGDLATMIHACQPRRGSFPEDKMKACSGAANYHHIAREFGLGRVSDVTPLTDGHPEVVKVTTELGQFVIKPAHDRIREELYARVAQALNQAGVRQARPRQSKTGAWIGESGHSVQEFLPGQALLDPTPEQTIAAMRHIGTYHAALGQVPVPSGLDAAGTLWTRVASPSYLIEHMPGLLKRSALPA